MYSRLCTVLLASGIVPGYLSLNPDEEELDISFTDIEGAKKTGSYKKSGYYGQFDTKPAQYNSLKKRLGSMVVSNGEEPEEVGQDAEELDKVLSQMITDLRQKTEISQPNIRLKSASSTTPQDGIIYYTQPDRYIEYCINEPEQNNTREILFFHVDDDGLPTRFNDIYQKEIRERFFKSKSCAKLYARRVLPRQLISLQQEWAMKYNYGVVSVARNLPLDDHRKQLYLYYHYGHADEDSYPEFMKGDIIHQDAATRQQRRDFGKQLYIAAMRSYLYHKAAPMETTGEEWVDFANNIFSYGCHCSPSGRGVDSSLATFKGTFGKAVNDLDQACHQRNQCYHCATDVDDSPDKCDYRKSYDFSINLPDFEFVCNDPLNTCDRRLCECDKEYFQQSNDFADIYDMQHRKDMGFDTEKSCQAPPKENRLAEGEKETWAQCCGVDGKRKPYSSTKQCCANNKPYSPDAQICCSDGKVLEMGGKKRCSEGATVVEE